LAWKPALVLSLTHPTGGAVLGAPSRIRVDIRDDDGEPSPLTLEEAQILHFSEIETLRQPAVATLASGGFAVAWSAQGRQGFTGLLSRLFDAGGRSSRTASLRSPVMSLVISSRLTRGAASRSSAAMGAGRLASASTPGASRARRSTRSRSFPRRSPPDEAAACSPFASSGRSRGISRWR